MKELPNTIFPMAGPGQTPESPQPIPNRTDPPMSFASMVPFFSQGKCHFSPKRGVEYRFRKKCPKRETVTAPSITKTRVGSQFPRISKNHWTRAGESISESASQNQKSVPDVVAIAKDGRRFIGKCGE